MYNQIVSPLDVYNGSYVRLASILLRGIGKGIKRILVDILKNYHHHYRDVIFKISFLKVNYIKLGYYDSGLPYLNTLQLLSVSTRIRFMPLPIPGSKTSDAGHSYLCKHTYCNIPIHGRSYQW